MQGASWYFRTDCSGLSRELVQTEDVLSSLGQNLGYSPKEWGITEGGISVDWKERNMVSLVED